MFTFILTFFVSAPLIIFYASGYRLDFKRGKIIKTGTLLIEGKDIKDAKLYLNNELYEKPFSEKLYIYNLIPGEYQVKLERDSYYPWQKKINIYSGLTTFTQDIVLFKKNIPLQLIDGQVSDFYLSPDWQKIVYLTKFATYTEIHLLNLETKEINLVSKIETIGNIELSWAASSKKILAQNKDTHLVFNIENLKEPIDLDKIMSNISGKISWDIDSDTLLYTLTADTIYKIDLVADKTEKIFSNAEQPINQEFFIEGNDIFYIEKQADQDILNKFNIASQNTKKILGLRVSDNYKFIPSHNNYLSLIDQKNQKLYLLQKVITTTDPTATSNDPVKEFNAIDANWDRTEKQLVIHSDFEIYTYNTESNSEAFINRYGQEIRNTQWYPNLSYLVILMANSLKILDLNLDNANRDITEIVKTENINNFVLDKKGEKIYFNGQIGKQNGLYQITVK